MVGSHLSDHLYYFEGKDYSKVPSAADQMYFQKLMKERVAEFLGATGSRTLRQKTIVSVFIVCLLIQYNVAFLSDHVKYCLGFIISHS